MMLYTKLNDDGTYAAPVWKANIPEDMILCDVARWLREDGTERYLIEAQDGRILAISEDGKTFVAAPQAGFGWIGEDLR